MHRRTAGDVSVATPNAGPRLNGEKLNEIIYPAS